MREQGGWRAADGGQERREGARQGRLEDGEKTGVKDGMMRRGLDGGVDMREGGGGR